MKRSFKPGTLLSPVPAVMVSCGEGENKKPIYADMASKIARCRLKAPENEHLSDHEMRKQIKRIDRNRAKYYEFYTGRKWGDKLNYDLCINTTNTEIKKIVPRIAKLF